MGQRTNKQKQRDEPKITAKLPNKPARLSPQQTSILSQPDIALPNLPASIYSSFVHTPILQKPTAPVVQKKPRTEPFLPTNYGVVQRQPTVHTTQGDERVETSRAIDPTRPTPWPHIAPKPLQPQVQRKTAVPAPPTAVRFTTPHAVIQRDGEGETGSTLTKGASIAYKQLKRNPRYSLWEKQRKDELKQALWERQPTEVKASLISFGLLNLGLLGTVFATDPQFRTDTIDFMQGRNLLSAPNLFIPHFGYSTLSSFKYNLPKDDSDPHTFKTEFSFDSWFGLMQRRWSTPKVGLSLGVDSSYSQSAGFTPLKGGNFTLKIGGGIINLKGFLNQTLPSTSTPVLINNPVVGEPPMWLMKSVPNYLEEELPTGHGLFLTIDVMRLPQLFDSPKSP